MQYNILGDLNMLQNAYFFLVLYLISTVLFNESYRMISQSMKKPGALTVLVEFIAGTCSLFLLPFFPFQIPNDPKIYFLLGLSIIFYAIQNRLATVARSGMEASSYGVLKQISNVFIILMGFLFLKEKLVLKKIIGAVLLIGSNILIFYEKGTWKKNHFLFLGIIANLCMGMALFLDVNVSNTFNLAFYVASILCIPSILTFFTERIHIKEILLEWKNSSKYLVLFTSVSWTIMMMTKLRAYQLGNVTQIAPLCSLTVILNAIFAFLFLKNRKNLFKKFIAGILVVIGVFLLK